jgi:hypothetical protein
MVGTRSSEMSVSTKPTRRHIQENGIFQLHLINRYEEFLLEKHFPLNHSNVRYGCLLEQLSFSVLVTREFMREIQTLIEPFLVYR